jgi:hypothetical protein
MPAQVSSPLRWAGLQSDLTAEALVAAPRRGQLFALPMPRAPCEIGFSKAIVTTDTHTGADAQDLDGSDGHADPSHSVPAMVLAADGVDIQSARRHLQSLALSLKTASTIDEVKHLYGQADALRAYLRNMGAALELQNEAAQVKIRIERPPWCTERAVPLQLGSMRSTRPTAAHGAFCIGGSEPTAR